MFPRPTWFPALLVLLAASRLAVADPATTGTATNVPAEAAAAQARLRVVPGLKVELWASEPLVRDPTSFCFDGLGRAYVVESGRRRTSVFDVRNFKDWVEDDLALRSVTDRAGFLRDQLATNAAFLAAATKSGRNGFRDFNGDGVTDVRDLEVESERIRLVWDASGSGHADQAVTFADGFNTRVSGVAAGILAQGTNIWFTCIPDLWRFPAAGSTPPTNSPLTPSAGERLLTGFGVHVAFGGHDLHGLIKGPDGRLYFTIADRGSCVTNREGRVISLPDTGAVFRCELDGANFEVFAHGLRNPQELAFDEFGNLWTGDNNGDGGDKARWTLVLEGADYGWTIGWQWLPKMGAWNSERLWHTRESNTAAYLVPPVAHVGHGPAGIAYYPGTGLGDRFDGHFFYADFPGGVRTFRVEPDGAFFRVADAGPWLEDNSATNITGKLLWNLTPVDVAFPPGGGVMVADAFPTWEKDGKGRLWRVFDPTLANDPLITETKRLLAEGMAQRSEKELAGLLGHRDMRVRLEAQWELAGKGRNSFDRFKDVAFGSSNKLARIHALWGIEQIARVLPPTDLIEELISLIPLLTDRDEDIRSQASKLLGEARLANAEYQLGLRLEDASPRVRCAAASALAKMYSRINLTRKHLYPASEAFALRAIPKIEAAYAEFPQLGPAFDPVLGFFYKKLRMNHVDFKPRLAELLATNSVTDPNLFHVAVVAFSVYQDFSGLPAAWANGYLSKAPGAENLRVLSALVARNTGHVWVIQQLLGDPAPQVVLEAARAINDVPIPEAMPALAALIAPRSSRGGEAPTSSPAASQSLLALAPATAWPTNLNFTHEEWRTWVLRRAVNANFRLGDPTNAVALAQFAARAEAPASVRVEALEDLAEWAQPSRRDKVVGLIRPLPPREPIPARDALATVWDNLTRSADTNVVLAALAAGNALKLADWETKLAAAAGHPNPAVRAEAARLAGGGKPIVVAELAAQLERGTVPERQSALARLAAAADPATVALLDPWAQQLVRGTVAPELQLDVLDALARQPNRFAARLAEWTNSLPKDAPLAPYRVALAGGDAANGRRRFAERADWGCQRCHKLAGEGGEVGPELAGIGKSKGRDYLLRAILNPNVEIAAGFENVIVTRKDGTSVVGVLKSESAAGLVLETPEDGRVTVKQADIASRDRGLSAMPEGLGDLMTKRELRDLIEALSQ